MRVRVPMGVKLAHFSNQMLLTELVVGTSSHHGPQMPCACRAASTVEKPRQQARHDALTMQEEECAVAGAHATHVAMTVRISIAEGHLGQNSSTSEPCNPPSFRDRWYEVKAVSGGLDSPTPLFFCS